MRTVVNSPTSWHTRVPHHARSASTIRRWLAENVGSLVPQHLADLHAVATELICNAVRHATPLPEGDLSVSCRLSDTELEFAVTDGGAASLPRMRNLDTSAPDGRGLLIVSALSTTWGVQDDKGGRTVWARLAPDAERAVHP
ncbi:anti-sigma regulatory factor (Ser/Thr protein kinase) [Stackebrandtia endophytica]|uniref:Anti-sigma regulatory factor (Ser/Thr protein kinase) n=1 Tax=Stackebrandtia endophytica TaxID=1496996 RepID=A0A543AXN7_9ACTN|nr:ATP-binding protein [Stackebrandtia endophytica]TQL77342.1 anti-sigma regulatory factor (Ser/Thr protein kinase) [Stackebrandtia endophytica]